MTQLGKKDQQGKATVALLLATCIWGFSGVAVKATMNAGLSPSAVVFGQYFLGALFVGLVFWPQIIKNYKKNDWKKGFLTGAVLFGGVTLQFTGLQHTTPGNCAFITAMYVVFVPFILWGITKKKPKPVMLIACVLSFAGAGILALDFTGGLSISQGDLFVLFASMLFAVQIVLLSIICPQMHPAVLVFTQLAGCVACSGPFYFLTGGTLRVYFSWEIILPILFLAIVTTALCFFLQSYAQSHLPGTRAGILMSTESLFGAFFSVLTGYDTLEVRLFGGGMLIVFSLMLSPLWQWIKSRRGPASQKPVG